MSSSGAKNDQSTVTERVERRETGIKIARLCRQFRRHERVLNERRNEDRYPFPYLITLSPVESDGLTPLTQPFSVVAKQISQGGIGFYYHEPMPYRYVVVSLPALNDEPSLHLLVDLTWCHRARPGWYENGGLFVKEVEQPALVGILESDESSS